MNTHDLPAGVEILAPVTGAVAEILTPAALEFLVELQREFNPRRLRLLEERTWRQHALDRGERPGFPAQTAAVRESQWQVLPAPEDLQDRRVEITGPPERKMVINAMNSGANCFMADFEDAHAPTWQGTLEGQLNVRDAVRGTIEYVNSEGKQYRLNGRPATLLVRPRGWHLPENHLRIDGQPASASLFDFALYFFHNARYRMLHDSGVYLYLPKLEHYLEARLWNDVFVQAQARLGIPQGTVKATVLIEHILAAFQMEEILYELRHHSAGLNCGRWDYIFSYIKKFARREEFLLPDRAQITMTAPFMRAYTLSCVRTCHRRGTFAIGGMAAFIPVKSDPAANEDALQKVREDKRREATDGHDGTWVAHPGLVQLAREEFDRVLGNKPNQIDRQADDIGVTPEQLLAVPQGTITEEGLRLNIRVAIQYLEAWLGGVGCVPLYNLMEDAATAEISRTQVWQWLHNPRARFDDGREINLPLVMVLIQEELRRIRSERGARRFQLGRFPEAAQLFSELVTDDHLEEFLTLKAYELLTRPLTSTLDNNLGGNAPQTTPPQSAPHLPAGNGEGLSLKQALEAGQAASPSKPSASLWQVPPGESRSLELSWRTHPRWRGVVRAYSGEKVMRLRGTMEIEHTIADRMSRKLWDLLQNEPYMHALGALTGNQAVQMAQAGLKAVYLSGWQVAADNNLASSTYPDQSLYPANSVPTAVRRLNKAFQRADQIQSLNGNAKVDYWLPIVADAEAGFGGPLNTYELMLQMIEEGAAGVHFEDQLASAKKCGHLGGKVLVPTGEFIRKLIAARLAADVTGVATVLIARTDAEAAKLLTSDFDERDQPFCTGERTAEGFFHVRAGLDLAITRALAYAPYADLLWCETSTPDLQFARKFAEGIKAVYPDKLLAYNCSPSFNWKGNLDGSAIAQFQTELSAMGYKFQFVTLAGFHALNLSMWELASGYRERHMAAYAELQEREFAAEAVGYTALKHQIFVGTGYFDEVASLCGETSTQALRGSTEERQFDSRTNRQSSLPCVQPEEMAPLGEGKGHTGS